MSFIKNSIFGTFRDPGERKRPKKRQEQAIVSASRTERGADEKRRDDAQRDVPPSGRGAVQSAVDEGFSEQPHLLHGLHDRRSRV